MKLWKLIDDFFFPTVDQAVFRVFRIALGIVLVLYYLVLIPRFIPFYSPDGLWPEPTRALSDYRPFDSLLFYIPDDRGMWIFYGVSISSAFLLILGLGGRLPIIWLWIANFSIDQRLFAIACGEEMILAILLLYAMFMPLSTPISVSPTGATQTVRGTWAWRACQLQFASVYLFSWPLKLYSDFAWRDGTQIYYSFHNQLFSRFAGAPWTEIFAWNDAVLSRVLSYGVLGIELAIPLLIWFRPTRMAVLVSAFALHLGMAIALDAVVMFNLVCIAGLMLYLPEDTARELVRRLPRPFGRDRSVHQNPHPDASSPLPLTGGESEDA